MAGTELDRLQRPVRMGERKALTRIFTPIMAEFVERVAAINPRVKDLGVRGNHPSHFKYKFRPEERTEEPIIRTVEALDYFPSVTDYQSTVIYRNRDEEDIEVIVPIGEYGSKWSFVLAEASRTFAYLMADDPRTRIDAEITHVVSGPEDQKTVKEHTYRKNPLVSSLEGIQSFVAILAMLTAKKVPGKDGGIVADPCEAAVELVESGIINEIALRIPRAQLIPLVAMGRYFPDALERDESGKLQLTNSFRGYLRAEHSGAQEEFNTIGPMSTETGEGCILARRDVTKPDGTYYEQSGIMMFGPVFLPHILYPWEQLQHLGN